MFGSITILDPGRMNHHNEKQGQNVDDDVALATKVRLPPSQPRIQLNTSRFESVWDVSEFSSLWIIAR